MARSLTLPLGLLTKNLYSTPTELFDQTQTNTFFKSVASGLIELCCNSFMRLCSYNWILCTKQNLHLTPKYKCVVTHLYFGVRCYGVTILQGFAWLNLVLKMRERFLQFVLSPNLNGLI